MSLRASTESNGPRDRSIATCVQKLYVYDVLDKCLFEDMKSWRDATGGINAQILEVGSFSVETHTPEGIKCPSVPDDVMKKFHDVVMNFHDVVMKFRNVVMNFCDVVIYDVVI